MSWPSALSQRATGRATFRISAIVSRLIERSVDLNAQFASVRFETPLDWTASSR